MAVLLPWFPQSLASETTHRFSANSFKLHRLPMPRPNEVLGLVGTNGIGKSTALKIRSGTGAYPGCGAFMCCDLCGAASLIASRWSRRQAEAELGQV